MLQSFFCNPSVNLYRSLNWKREINSCLSRIKRDHRFFFLFWLLKLIGVSSLPCFINLTFLTWSWAKKLLPGAICWQNWQPNPSTNKYQWNHSKNHSFHSIIIAQWSLQDNQIEGNKSMNRCLMNEEFLIDEIHSTPAVSFMISIVIWF